MRNLERITSGDVDNNKTIDLILLNSCGEIIKWKNPGNINAHRLDKPIK